MIMVIGTETRTHEDIRNMTRKTTVGIHTVTALRTKESMMSTKVVEIRNVESHDEMLKKTTTTIMTCRIQRCQSHKIALHPIVTAHAVIENERRRSLEISTRVVPPKHTKAPLDDTTIHTMTTTEPMTTNTVTSEQVDQPKRVAASTTTEKNENEETETTSAPKRTNIGNEVVTIEKERKTTKTQTRKNRDGDPANINVNIRLHGKIGIETAIVNGREMTRRI